MTVPINWIHLSDDRKKIVINSSSQASSNQITALVVIPQNPVGWNCATQGTEVVDTEFGEIKMMPGPQTWLLETTSESEQEIMAGVFNGVMNMLQGEFNREKSWRDGGGVNWEFTLDQMPESLIRQNQDAVGGAIVSDGRGEKLWEVWILRFNMVDGRG